MTTTYKEDVTNKIKEIADNISLVDGELYDRNAYPKQIKEAVKQYDAKMSNHLPDKDYHELLLSNWIYCHYYQNRGVGVDSDLVDHRHFPFKDMSKEGSEAYWRSRFWRFDSAGYEREKSVLTRGYETRIVEAKQFVEDDFVFETNKDKDKNVFEEIQYVSVVFSKFEIGTGQKFVFGKYPLDNDGQGGIIRFYLHLDVTNLAVAIPIIIAAITASFNSRLIPFQLKFLEKALDFARADHFVIYIENRHFFVAGILLENLYDQISIFLDKRALPLFVRQVLPGIGFAKNPGRGEMSFGANRSKVLAKAILAKLKDNSKTSAAIHLEETWGGLENFDLNPKPKLARNFQVFDRRKNLFFQDIEEADTLSAAWYIARLLCREAIWVAPGECNWMSYLHLGQDHFGYCFLGVKNGMEGLEGIIIFLKAFQKMGIRDTLIEFVLAAAEAFFAARGGQSQIVEHRDAALSEGQRSAKPGFKMNDLGFRSEELKSEIEQVIFGDLPPKLLESGLLERIMKEHIQLERPIGNRLDGSDNFCADLQSGLAGYGYAYLRLYDSMRVAGLVKPKNVTNTLP